MPRYRYQVIKFGFSHSNISSDVQKMNSYLNEQAEEGWRVVSITSVPVGESDHTNYPLIVVLEKEG